MSQVGLRERTRRAVQKEITEAANALFLARGYEQTTIEDIASAVGLSQRSVFRYFPSKEELIIGKFEFVAEEMLEIFRTRPAHEPVWDSLRRMFDLLVPLEDNPQEHDVAKAILGIIFSTPALFASYLQKLQQIQQAIVMAAIEQAGASRLPRSGDDPVLRALIAAAFGCLVAAQQSWLAAGANGKFGDWIDRAMTRARPADEAVKAPRSAAGSKGKYNAKVALAIVPA
ncbi:TetR/AcrR family transcriptional regulator [Sphingobium subterraneum]|uniref:AcrR family transcriptional regulator n=1 Tax=Sphingobium subterraneum TaxID=627688 RepID=A0A841IZ08_9SPHN|nr:TetR/AcrR family transcriptional regulator [Sphingobium subterraneum]MBB6123362.1 AcrR family transcriptional regulator [Sphingobium subterraneum]